MSPLLSPTWDQGSRGTGNWRGVRDTWGRDRGTNETYTPETPTGEQGTGVVADREGERGDEKDGERRRVVGVETEKRGQPESERGGRRHRDLGARSVWTKCKSTDVSMKAGRGEGGSGSPGLVRPSRRTG